MRIYLVGMPGSGKTTLSKELSSLISFPFVDLDTILEEREGKTIPEIFSEKGEAFFREVEKEIVHTYLPEETIIATGGGAPCFFDNMDFMLKNGVVIFVDVHEDQLIERVWSEHGSRPLLAQQKKEEMYNAIKSKRIDRLPFYTQAQYVINAEKKSPIVIAKEIKQLLANQL